MPFPVARRQRKGEQRTHGVDTALELALGLRDLCAPPDLGLRLVDLERGAARRELLREPRGAERGELAHALEGRHGRNGHPVLWVRGV